MSHLALARKYRPTTFEDMVGQEPIAAALRNAVTHGRLGQAYIFAGPRGVGKTSMARILAKTLNCPNVKDATPCNECEICRAVGVGEDVDVLEIDGASHRTVDEIQPIIGNLLYPPIRSPHKIYIIDEVHMLSRHAFNALLKSIEEPPPYVIFIFATTEPQKVPETVRSRCQHFDFRPLTPRHIYRRLSHVAEGEGITVEPGLLRRVARFATGSMRDAVSLLDQLVSYAGEAPTVEALDRMLGVPPAVLVGTLLSALLARDAKATAEAYRNALAQGRPETVVEELTYMVRDVLFLAVTGKGEHLLYFSEPEAREFAGRASETDLTVLFANLVEVRNRMRLVPHGDLLAEVALLRLARRGAVAEAVRVAARAPAPVPAPSSRKEPVPAPSSRKTSSPRKEPVPAPAPRKTSSPRKEPVPAPRKEPVPAPAPESEGDDWPALRERAKKNLVSLRHKAILASATLLRREDDVLVVGVHPGNVERDLEKEALERRISDAFSEALGRRIRVRLEPDETLRSAARKSAELKFPSGPVQKVFPGAVLEEVRDAVRRDDEAGAETAAEDGENEGGHERAGG